MNQRGLNQRGAIVVGGGNVEQIVDNLKRKPQLLAKLVQLFHYLVGGASDDGPQPERTAKQGASFAPMDRFELRQGNFLCFGRQVGCLASDQGFRPGRVGQGRTTPCGHIAGVDLGGQHLERPGLEGIPNQDGQRFVELNMASCLTTAEVVVIHGGQIVMD